MSALPSQSALVSVLEYLEREVHSTERHEFHDGRVVAMAGGTYKHSVVCLNVGAVIREKLKGTPCRASESNTRVAVRPGRSYLYPDVTVICGGPDFDPNDRNRMTITNPTVVVEVLSDGTEAYDRGKKFERYREAASLKEYVLVLTTEPRVETFLRQSDGTWLFTSYSGLDAVARLRSVEIDLPLSEVFDGVEFLPTGEDTGAAGGAGSAVT